ncbi:MAG: hypothetical protein WD069_10965 [Planctomycetales bacterium]
MRVLIAALACGAAGGLLFLAPLFVGDVPESLALLNLPGSMLAPLRKSRTRA